MGRREKERKALREAQCAQDESSKPLQPANTPHPPPHIDAPASDELVKFPSLYDDSVADEPKNETATNSGKWIFARIPPEEDTPPQLSSVMMCWENVKQRVLDPIPGFPLPFDTPSPPVHKIAPVEGAGLGMFAAADFDIGDTILRERPLLATPCGAHIPVLLFQENLDVLSVAEQTMHPANRALFNALSNCKKPPHTEISGRLSSNAFTIELAPPYHKAFGAVARDMSRINHSCVPNAYVRFDVKTFAFTLRAVAPIRKGEQICTSYLSFAEEMGFRDDRQAELLRKYDFTCKCPACAPAVPNSVYDPQPLSDGRRTYLLEYCREWDKAEAVFARWLKDGAPRPSAYESVREHNPRALFAVQDAETNAHLRALRAWRQVEKEGYAAMRVWNNVLEMLCRTSAVLQDAALVRKCATLAARYGLAYFGVEDNGWRAVAEAPERTEWWGKTRARKTLKAREAARVNGSGH